MHKCTNQPVFTTFKWISAYSDCLDLIHLDKSNLLDLDPRLDTLASESTIYIVFISWQAATECWLHVTWPSVEVVVSLRSASVKWPNGFIQEAKLVEKSEMLLISPFLSLQRHGLSQMSTKWCNGRSQGWSCPGQNRIGIRLAKKWVANVISLVFSQIGL